MVYSVCVSVAVEKGSNPAGGPVLTIHGFPTSSHDWSKVCLPVYCAACLSVCLSVYHLACLWFQKDTKATFYVS